MIDARIMSLFGAVLTETDVAENDKSATVVDIAALAMEYRYALTPDFVSALEAMNGNQRGTIFVRMGDAFASNIDGMSAKVSPLYRAFPNHEIVPFEMRLAVWLLNAVGANLTFDPALYGADPVTGFQTDIHGGNVDLDGEYTVDINVEAGNSRRKIRFLKNMSMNDLGDKATAMLGNLSPFTTAELGFVTWALESGAVDSEGARDVKFREKLPLVAEKLSAEDYAALCNSVTDALRLAVHLSGPRVTHGIGYNAASSQIDADLSLKSNPRFKLNKGQGRKVMKIVDAILERGNTDHQTDFMRHAEMWKRFAKHVVSNQYDRVAPRAAEDLRSLRSGKMTSWEQRYAAAEVDTKIDMAMQRPGELARRITALSRAVNTEGKGRNRLISAARTALPEVNAMTLLQLNTHMAKTANTVNRFHALPNGTLMKSERGREPIPFTVKADLEKHLRERLAGTLSFSRKGIPSDAYGMFVPVGGRNASEGDTRSNRGDRVKLSFEDSDTIRFFLHWHESCDVDMSAVAYNKDLDKLFDCAYYNLNETGMKHSGDILNGSNGAAEYIDIDVAKAKKRGVRYILMNANVYSGNNFDTFECNVGLMIRDGQTGQHFECSTVESKMSLDSANRNCTPALLDLDTGEMIYVDLSGNWNQGANVHAKAGTLKETLDYFVNYDKYRTSFGDIIEYAGSDDPDAPKATVGALRAAQDEILAEMADA